MLRVNGVVFGNELFLNREAIYKEVGLGDTENVIQLNFEGNEDITNLMMAARYIRSEQPNCKLKLQMNYLPYSAMDRKINVQIFSLKYLADLINMMKFDTVEILDPHNEEVTTQLIERVAYTDINRFTSQAILDFKPDVIYFPDAGAYKKYPKALDTMNLPVAHGKKVRDTLNKGKLIAYEVVKGDVDLNGARVLIIDDICRKGGTFLMASSALLKEGVKEIGLYISHCEAGIFSGDVLAKDSPITKVYTTDSEPAFLRVMKEEGNEDKASKLVVLTF